MPEIATLSGWLVFMWFTHNWFSHRSGVFWCDSWCGLVISLVPWFSHQSGLVGCDSWCGLVTCISAALVW